MRVALLRGVNLGKRKVIMSDLRAVCEAAGFKGARTVLASGNLLLRAKLSGAKLEARLEQVILDGLGLKTDVFVFDADQLDAIIRANPFKAFAQKAPSFLAVYFMRGPACASEWEAMQSTALTGEEIKPGKHCLYVTFPAGQGASRLRTPKLATARNWNTVTKLAALARGA